MVKVFLASCHCYAGIWPFFLEVSVHLLLVNLFNLNTLFI